MSMRILVRSSCFGGPICRLPGCQHLLYEAHRCGRGGQAGEAQGGQFNTFKVNGVSIQEAVSKWWNAPTTAPAMNYEPCMYKTTSPHKCNPTC